MGTFAEWLRSKELNDLSEVQTLRSAAQLSADKWAAAKDEKSDYTEALEEGLPEAAKPAAKAALDALWPLYASREAGDDNERVSLFSSGAVRQLLVNLPAAAVAVAAGVILVLFFRAFSHIQLSDLATPAIARGLLTFLFGVTTVGIAIIVVVAVFLGNGNTTELGDRFQRGKDILTVLIGVFGAILGYYFGSDKSTGQATPPPPVVGYVNAGAAAKDVNGSGAGKQSEAAVKPAPPAPATSPQENPQK